MKLTRRNFLIGSAAVGGGLVLGFKLSPEAEVPHTIAGSFQPNAWLQILPTGEVIFQCDKSEMGQGNMTGLTYIIAEELDFDPHQMKVEFAGIHKAFRNTELGVMLTGASTSIKTGWPLLRQAGASARKMLIEAAAKTWGVSASTLSTEPCFVVNPSSGDKLSYGELVGIAKDLSVPSDVKYKDVSEYRWLGKSSKRLDIESKVHTTATFGVDVDLPEVKVAVVVRSPYFGGKPQSYDAQALLQRNEIVSVFEIHSGIAIVADDYWQARKAANELFPNVEWDKGPMAGVSNATIEAAQKAKLDDPEDTPFYPHQDDDVQLTLDQTADDKKIIDVEYGAGFFHHSPMEPQNASALYNSHENKMTIWAPSQSPEMSREVAHHFTLVPQENIEVKTTFLGGGFGRRGYVDFSGEAAAIAHKLPNQAIKLIWSREDDMQHDYYRPTSTHRLSGAVDSEGNISAYQHCMVSNSILNGFGGDLIATLLPTWVPTKLARSMGRGSAEMFYDYDITMAEGANPEYNIGKREIGLQFYNSGIPTGFWRSVGHSYTGFVKESMIDELAHLANMDPVQFRLKNMNSPRLKVCLEKVIEMSDWGNKGDGVYQGISCHESFMSYVAQVADIVIEDGKAKIVKVYCVADVGFALNPEIVQDQLTSGIVYGLTAALKPHVKIEDGKVIGSNFHDMPVLRMNECPEMETAIIDSLEEPKGVGEISVPPIASAVSNALFAWNGVRQRQLPLSLKKSEAS